MPRHSIAFLAAALFAAAPNVAAAAPTFGSTLTARCAGGALGCEQVDFFLTLRPTTASTLLDFLSITITSPDVLFSTPNISDGDEGGVPSFIDPAVTNGGATFTANYPLFSAMLAPTLRVRAELTADAGSVAGLRATYVGGSLDEAELVSGALVTTPEPATAALVGLGLAGVAVVGRRRRA
jgi:hypothetical protein